MDTRYLILGLIGLGSGGGTLPATGTFRLSLPPRIVQLRVRSRTTRVALPPRTTQVRLPRRIT
jgi:hypothetical protein